MVAAPSERLTFDVSVATEPSLARREEENTAGFRVWDETGFIPLFRRPFTGLPWREKNAPALT